MVVAGDQLLIIAEVGRAEGVVAFGELLVGVVTTGDGVGEDQGIESAAERYAFKGEALAADFTAGGLHRDLAGACGVNQGHVHVEHQEGVTHGGRVMRGVSFLLTRHPGLRCAQAPALGGRTSIWRGALE